MSSNQWRWSVPPLHCLIIKRYEWAFNRHRHHHQKQVHQLCVFRFQTSKQDRTTHTNRQEGQGQRLTTTSITNSGRRRRMQCIGPNMHQLFACGYLLSLWIPPVTDLCTHLILECTFYILLCNVRLTYIHYNWTAYRIIQEKININAFGHHSCHVDYGLVFAFSLESFGMPGKGALFGIHQSVYPHLETGKQKNININNG